MGDEGSCKGSDKGSAEFLAGGALTALVAAEVAVGAAVCPLCVVGAPVFLGVGAIKRLKSRKKAPP
jgi:hypothetical protein